MNLSKIIKDNLIFFVLGIFFIAFSVFLLIHNLGRFPLENWDEAFYGQTTKEMLQTRDLVVLHWNSTVWLEKPPMFMWVTSFLSLIFGMSEFILRLPSAVNALALIILATVWVYKKYSILPSIFTFFTLALNNIFIYRARSANIDLLVSFFIFLTFLINLSKNKFKYPLLGFLFAFVYLTKASLVLFPFVVFVLGEIVYEHKNFRKNLKEYFKLLAVFLGLSGAWLMLAYFQQGTAYVHYFLFQSDQGVATLANFNQNYILHVYYSLQRRFFWLFVVGLSFALLKIKSKEYFLLLAYSLLLLIQLSFSSKDNNWYLIPSIPFWSIIIGFAVYSILNLLKTKKILYFGFITLLIVVSGYIWFKTFSVNILPILNSSSVIDQVQSAKEISSLSNPNDVIVRLDPLIPTTLYYDFRKTLAYDPNTNTHGYWISKTDLIKQIKNKKIKWLVGTNQDAQNFLQFANPNLFDKIQANKSEVILKVK